MPHPLTDFRERQDPKLNLVELASLLEVSVASISRWEAGERKIDEGLLARISERTGIPARELRPDLAELFAEGATESARA